MNRFRTKKRAKDDAPANRTSEDSEHSSLPSFKGFRRGKKTQNEEPKKEIDLAAALPSNDDFRTSLLMTNLSARFSMLREQDDPNTKIGKASDDSVLYPKRQSRLPDFGFGGVGLSDIAEVESIKAAPFMRNGSFASDDTESTKGASVMNRAKPTEGNNLFGGRQKIYKIPAGPSSKNQAGGMSGRALYDDDVAMSSFQRWRQAERERALEEEAAASMEAEDEADQTARSESPPPVGYNRKRETSSTTSSASAIARNSTAATSFTSQPTASVKDWQSVSTAPTSAASTPALERNVTRTRRLYEQGLTQEMQEQQSSALSRIDTLSRQRILGNRTPDHRPNSPSPTANAFLERSISEKRTMLTKASAPNLRTVNTPTTGSSGGMTNLGIRVPAQADTSPSFGGSPPLSPPISETGDQHVLSIQPNDVGKATAMGVFQKPSQPYDESKYAQRQIQLQQGRETPTRRFRAESNASLPAVQEESTPSTFLDDSESVSSDTAPSTQPSTAPKLTIQRPSDQDHPAFRQSALPTPLSYSSRSSNEPSPISEEPRILVENSVERSPEDSPTLGPVSGLSGMVRQHLRSESNVSSIYDGAPQSTGLESRFPSDAYERPIVEGLGPRSNPWISSEHDWALSYYGDSAAPKLKQLEDISSPDMGHAVDSTLPDRSSNDMLDEKDEFANQLADARRRVRERLTSYVESDSSRSASPSRQADLSKDIAAQAPPNPLGLDTLKPKSSRGSLADRSRGIVAGQSKAAQKLGIGASTMSTSPSPNKQSFDSSDIAPVRSTDRNLKEDHRLERHSTSEGDEADSANDKEDESNTHPGLKAFRQARRELQKRKELETLAQRQISNTAPSQDQVEDYQFAVQSPPKREGGQGQRMPSTERKAPPVLYRQRAPSEEASYGMNANSPSVPKNFGERGRSGPDPRGHHRPPLRPKNNNSPNDGQQAPNHHPRPPMLRTPGLPGTDIRRSPIMPPQGYPGRPVPSPGLAPHVLDRSKSAGNLAVHSGRPGGYDTYSGQPSPISPLPPASPFAIGLPSSPAATTAPTSMGPRSRRPSAAQSPGFGPTAGIANGSVKRVVDKREISEPTFVRSTSRVPTVNLPHLYSAPDMSGRSDSRSGSRSRSNSGGGHETAPPVPPINPRRRREAPRPDASFGEASISATQPPFAGQIQSTASLDYVDDHRTGFLASDDEDVGKLDQQRRLRKVNVETSGLGGRILGSQPRDVSPPFIVKGPPASRMVVTSGPKVNHGMGGAGGMF
ncbi:hypothetical protein B0T17DRAFT_644585 [Bombardia bombarda]|uniref:Uncharacterized protein n=1 Tax=Bombardia bombarda TaxID=252184 RepID=A0AA39WHP6_9PEZI|nr:hypothetical protein B0T17DRAFT_644585 [Bombardia bombarda]